jgi:hypothetical protein
MAVAETFDPAIPAVGVETEDRVAITGPGAVVSVILGHVMEDSYGDESPGVERGSTRLIFVLLGGGGPDDAP